MKIYDSDYNKIVRLCQKGDEYKEKGKYAKAIEKYKAALRILPSPKEEWDASTWVYTLIGDAMYLNQEYSMAIYNFIEARKCPDGMTNPFVNLRLGESYFEIRNTEKATEALLQAYKLGGKEIFMSEKDCYFELISKII